MLDILAMAGMPTTAGFTFDLPNKRGRAVGLDHFARIHGYEVGREVWYAAKIVEQIADLRHAKAGGNRDEIEHQTLHLGVLLNEANTQLCYGGTFDRGEIFEGAPKLPRCDRLARLIDEALGRLGTSATPKDILRDIEGEADVQEVDPDNHTIYWRSDRGVEKKTSFKRFQDRVTDRKRKFLQKP
jgi:hypothetical protein